VAFSQRLSSSRWQKRPASWSTWGVGSLQRRCRQLESWRRDYPELAFIVRVNTSPAQYVVGGLAEFVEECLRIHDIPGDRMCIEMTEHAVLQEPEQTVRILHEFQRLGVEVAI